MPVKFNYTEEAMQKALKAVAEGMSVNKVAKTFVVPRTTLLYKHTGKTPIERKMGPQSILTKDEENVLENWIICLGKEVFLLQKINLSTVYRC